MAIQAVIPLRVYEDMEAAQRFLVDVFGFKRGRLDRDPSGRPVHAEVSIGDSVIWIHRVDPEHGLVSARSLPAQPGGLVVFVKDVDAHYHHARIAGATIDSPPTDQSYGQREYSARDPEGNLWYSATSLH
ncbi:MAG TPA: VOC family protein [Candidatus Bathyarchaeia archaeon]|nr:VOC family protein [Candidatus Bathyarchaeia archaeon]